MDTSTFNYPNVNHPEHKTLKFSLIQVIKAPRNLLTFCCVNHLPIVTMKSEAPEIDPHLHGWLISPNFLSMCQGFRYFPVQGNGKLIDPLPPWKGFCVFSAGYGHPLKNLAPFWEFFLLLLKLGISL